MAKYSLATLTDFFPYMEETTVRKLKDYLDAKKPLQMIDSLLENFGIEYILDNRGDMVAKYSNTGDTYAATVFVVNGHYRVTTLGDLVESWERNKRRKLA